MQHRSALVATLTALALMTVAADKAPKGESVALFFADAPKDVQGPKNAPWTAVQRKNYGNWIQKKLAGQTVTLAGRLRNTRAGSKTASLVLIDPKPFTSGGISVTETEEVFAFEDTSEAGKVNDGESVVASGTVDTVVLNWRVSETEQSVKLQLKMKASKLVSHSVKK